MLLTVEQFQEATDCRRSLALTWFEPMRLAMIEFDFATPLRAAMLLAQVSYECNGFERLEENLNYSAEGLARVWPNRYAVGGKRGGPPNIKAKALARKPEQIANETYANRMGNGPPESGDGWFHRGYGPIMLTGLDAHREYGIALGVDLVKEPWRLMEPAIGSRSAARYCALNGVGQFADRRDVAGATRAIQGGSEGLSERSARFSYAVSAWGIA